ncbi:MAG: Serine/threonine-protein kinase pkn1 [Lentisphaerae bacterium ADurb.BinA184]|nr:MAG: Serine/threonine-protein kinase pkn1 [Lentisphaerae bacterium ADurb.BinA184]
MPDLPTEFLRCMTAEELPTTLHYLAAVHLSGRLEVTPGAGLAGRGLVFMENGRIVAAQMGKTRGVEAVARMLVWPSSEIRLTRRVVAPWREFDGTAEQTLMEASVLADQNAALWLSLAQRSERIPEQAVSPAAPVRRVGWRMNWGRVAAAVSLVALGAALAVGLRQSLCPPRHPSPGGGRGPEAPPAGRVHSVGDSSPLKPFSPPGLQMRLLPVPPGTLIRRFDDRGNATPAICEVRFPDPFWMSANEVMQADCEAVTGRNPSAFKGGDLPVDSIAWQDAARFCAQLTEREHLAGRLPPGYEYRLPSELEWEYVCWLGHRPGRRRPLTALAWFRENSAMKTHPVGSKAASPPGFHDLYGNVAEWCLDWLGHSPGQGVSQDALPAGTTRACRGGSWLQPAEFCTPDRRVGIDWASATNIIGFRVVLARGNRPPEVAWTQPAPAAGRAGAP